MDTLLPGLAGKNKELDLTPNNPTKLKKQILKEWVYFNSYYSLRFNEFEKYQQVDSHLPFLLES